MLVDTLRGITLFASAAFWLFHQPYRPIPYRFLYAFSDLRPLSGIPFRGKITTILEAAGRRFGGSGQASYRERLWAGGGGSGLVRYDERAGRFKHYRHNPEERPPEQVAQFNAQALTKRPPRSGET